MVNLYRVLYAKFGIDDEFPYPTKMFLKWPLLLSGVLILGMIFKENIAVRWTMGALLGIYLLRNIIRRKAIF